jgi:hypothetical protein
MQIVDDEEPADEARARKTAAATAEAKSYMAEQLATLKGRHADMLPPARERRAMFALDD